MSVDVEFFNDVFVGGAITEQRIDAACVKIMTVAQSNVEDAKKADFLLKDIILLGIANGAVSDPRRCVELYFSLTRAAFGEPTLLDTLKRQITGETY